MVGTFETKYVFAYGRYVRNQICGLENTFMKMFFRINLLISRKRSLLQYIMSYKLNCILNRHLNRRFLVTFCVYSNFRSISVFSVKPVTFDFFR